MPGVSGRSEKVNLDIVHSTGGTIISVLSEAVKPMKRLLSATSLLVVGAYCLAQTSLPNPPEPAANTGIRHVTFENAHILTPEEQKEIVKPLQRETEGIHPPDPPVWAEWAKERVRGAYQDRGYWRVEVDTTATPVTDIAGSSQLDIAVKILNEGPQYRLRDLHCSGMTVFSEAQLLALIPIHAGEVFSRSKVEEGLEAIRRLYDSRGYINFTSVPDTQIDDDARNIALSISVDEGKQFRMGHLEVLGADAGSAQLLQAWVLQPGEIYRQLAVREFFRDLHLVPPGEPGSPVVTKLDEGNGIVDIVLDLRKLEPGSPTPQEPTSASNR